MIRSTVFAVLGLVSVVGIGLLPMACQGGGVGDPCTPEDEYNPQFAGFNVDEENIESRSFQCQTRICLVNHFQGRVSCPGGQAPPVTCTPNGQVGCTTGSCVAAGVNAPACMTDADCGTGGHCDPAGQFCDCSKGGDTQCQVLPPAGTFFCDTTSKQCTTYVCHAKDNCQNAGSTGKDLVNKDCCLPGTDTPVTSEVCGQCNTQSRRNAANAVYCSCRCGPADGQPLDPNFNYCKCPNGFECDQVRADVGIADPQLSGKYCIQQGTLFTDDKNCGGVTGFFDSTVCKGRQM